MNQWEAARGSFQRLLVGNLLISTAVNMFYELLEQDIQHYLLYFSWYSENMLVSYMASLAKTIKD